MDVQDKDEKIKALRGNLKNGRINQSGEDPSRDSAGDDQSSGADFQAAGREIANLATTRQRSTTNSRKPGGNGRSPETKPVRLGRTDRRHGEDNGGFASDADLDTNSDTRSIGRFIADGTTPERKPLDPDSPDALFDLPVRSENIPVTLSSKYPAANGILSENPDISVRKLAKELACSVDTAHRVKKEWTETHKDIKPTSNGLRMPKGNLLTKTEAQEMSESFTAALESDFQAIDQYLWHRQLAAGIDTDEQPVWSNADTEEVSKLTKIMMKWGQRNEAAAAISRGVVDSSDYIAVASIFVPRVKQTVDIIRKTRKPRVRRGQAQHDNQA